MRTYCGVDTYDPQAPESTLTLLAVSVRVTQAALDCFDCASEEAAMCSSIPTSELKDSVVTSAGFKAPFSSWHNFTSGRHVALSAERCFYAAPHFKNRKG